MLFLTVPIGHSSFKLEPWNTYFESASYRHISLKILEEFSKVLERVSFELGQQKSHFRISMQPPVENLLMTIENFDRQFQIGEKERKLVK